MNIDLIWSAGFFDGEGSITIKRYKRVGLNGSLRYQSFMSISQVDKPSTQEAMQTLKRLYGGCIALNTIKANPNWCPTLQWSVVSRDAMRCVEVMLPYLKIKKSQAELLIKYGQELEKYNVENGHRLSEAELAKRDKFYWQMRDLNARGMFHQQRLNEETAKADVIV